ncbi:hypothetical protein ACIQZB_00620 [Streptomyces sp. NPDC097727]|uniref:hypothetical protein n=1 Tax=Streptomyces sp. NPDC097727 TaxID=3366092 RepID=UPI00382209AD
MSRAYCRCSTVQNYDYDEAATKLKCKARFLRDNISRLPHQKLGDSVAFCDCELALIQAMFSVMPASVEAPAESASQGADTPAIAELMTIKPSRARRSRAVS